MVTLSSDKMALLNAINKIATEHGATSIITQLDYCISFDYPYIGLGGIISEAVAQMFATEAPAMNYSIKIHPKDRNVSVVIFDD
jgi:hypothetical protein